MIRYCNVVIVVTEKSYLSIIAQVFELHGIESFLFRSLALFYKWMYGFECSKRRLFLVAFGHVIFLGKQ